MDMPFSAPFPFRCRKQITNTFGSSDIWNEMLILRPAYIEIIKNTQLSKWVTVKIASCFCDICERGDCPAEIRQNFSTLCKYLYINTICNLCVSEGLKNIEKPPKMSPKRAPFGFRKGLFRILKGSLSHSQRAPFANQEDKNRKIGRFFMFRSTIFPVFRLRVSLKRK